jgi:glycosyltransferase involved in cell wall biosynthesis
MSKGKLLSIVTPTRGNFSDYWFEQLQAIKGDVEFVLVYPLGASIKPCLDPRIKLIVSPFKGEVFQRMLGLLNASGKYVINIDDDDFIHPDVLELVDKYFQKFPDSWLLRLMVEGIGYRNQDAIQREWDRFAEIDTLEIVPRKNDQSSVLQELPIAPLKNPFDLRFLVGIYLTRKDMHGAHVENFNNKVWRNDLVQAALVELTQSMIILKALTWIPKWNLDRLLGLFIQATFFKEGEVIGHWMPFPAQVRYVSTPQYVKGDTFRLMLPADALLVKRFPQYGYFWNLFFEQFWVAVRKTARAVLSFRFTCFKQLFKSVKNQG